MSYYERNLPHWQPDGAVFFITFRLAGTLPEIAVQRLKRQREQANKNEETEIKNHIFEKYKHLIDGNDKGPTWLGKNKIASVVQKSLHHYNDDAYDLYAYCIMPNHVHIVFKHLDSEEKNRPENDYQITNILHSIKSYTALKCNRILDRSGEFWQSESYDHVIQNKDELENTIRYTLNNPVKAGLVDKWEDWPYNYCKPGWTDSFRSL